MAIEDQRIHQNRKRNNQNRPTNNLIVDEYDGETLSHDKANAKTRKVHIISGLDIFSKKEFNMKEKDSENLEKEVLTQKLYVLRVKHSQTF